jgi:N-acetylglucosaminyldiphosphoundecaprenol N-acetyl-beta-D-mannosaminyltransferase
MGPSRKRVRLGRLYADDVTFDEAVDEIIDLVKRGEGGYVVTPNVDHVVLAETDETLVNAYLGASLSLVDGMPLLWLARALGHPLPEKISGSDLVEPVVERASARGVGVYFLGAKEGVGARAAEILQQRHPELRVAGVDAPPLGFEKDPDELAAVIERVHAGGPSVVLLALGCPKQERFMLDHAKDLAPSVLLGIGATLDFIAGNVQRAPGWMQRAGLEWTWRLAQEPRRMAHRYLVRDREIVRIAWEMSRVPHAGRAFYVARDDAGSSGAEGRRQGESARSFSDGAPS